MNKSIENLFRNWAKDMLGINPDVISQREYEIKVSSRMSKCQITDPFHYWKYVLSSPEEQQALIEIFMVPETWFFREKGSLDFLLHYVESSRILSYPEKVLRILSVACSSGEEPYSIAMTLFKYGLSPSKFHIDAVDISLEALKKAENGVYGTNSFRTNDLSFRDLFFEPLKENLYQLQEIVKRQVSFHQVNIVQQKFMQWPQFYHLIFCRNVLIYLTSEARATIFKAFDRLLLPEGRVILGHAEAELIKHSGYSHDRYPKACVFMKTKEMVAQPEKRATTQSNKIQHHPKPKKESIKPSVPTKLHALKSQNSQKSNELVEDILLEAFSLADKGFLAKAKNLCEKFLKNNGSNIKANFLLATIYLAMQNDDDAEKYLQRVIYLDPQHDEALLSLALLSEKKEEYEKAELLRKRAMKALGLNLKNKRS